MKKCPTCSKTFEDSMRFCQSDGTPLVDDAPAFDPYATVVARPEQPAAEMPQEERVEVGISPIAEPEEVLDLPAADPLKTMYVSEDEMRAALGGSVDPDDPEMEIPPQFAEPEIASPKFTDVPPIASPFAVTESSVETAPPSESTGAPIPSPFENAGSEADMSEPATMIQSDPLPPFQPSAPPSPFGSPEPPTPYQASEPVFTPESPVYQDPEPAAPAYSNPFDQPPAAAEWTPPPAPVAGWQDQGIGQNTPFQPPVAGGEGANKTLATVSLVCGIAGILCCGLLSGIPAIITGYIAKNNVDSNPQEYGGRGLAVAGMVLGGISVVLTIIVIILQVFLGVMGNLR
jgi:hypothetical protein